MRKSLLCAAALSLLAGCGSTTTSYVKSETTLGRVVVYRNGVAYFERYAEVQGDSLKLAVPHDKVDDFLKSLTVIDLATGEPAAVSYPSAPEDGTIDMKVGVGANGKSGTHKLKLSYVTEAPSWKPSYRVTLGKNEKVDLQGWAIVDNTSGEDWRDVKLGVGASSALSFRFDLKGLRLVERETLQDNERFASAPPMGAASYGQGGQHRVVGEFDDNAIAMADQPHPVLMAEESVITNDGKKGPRPAKTPTASAPPPPSQVAQAATSLKQAQGNPAQKIIVEGYATGADKDKAGASQDRANRLRDQLVRQGVDANRIVALGRGEQAGHNGGARVVEAQAQIALADPPKAPTKVSGEPIGQSHFESALAMTVPKGTSAMVSILRGETEGEVVYLFDPDSTRGNTQYPFRTLRFRNPTDSALESGPVTVFGDGKFVGEGLAEPIPAHSVAYVPFALDRQIVVERKDAEHDDIARIITVNRGVFSTEIKHTKKATFTVYNRMGEHATLFLKHNVTPGYKLSKFPDSRAPVPGATDSSDHLSGANLFKIELEPNGKADVEIEEATPVMRTTDIRNNDGLNLVRAYLSSAAIEPPLKARVEQLLKLNADLVKVNEEIQTTREQMVEYRTRMDELHAQLVTLKAVKTAGPLMSHLEKTLQDISEKLSKATVNVVALQEKAMVSRIQFESGVADLTLEEKGATATASR